MSAYTSQSFINACFERLRAIDPSIDASVIPRLFTMLAPALESLAQKVGSSTDRHLRNLLRELLGTVTITSGAGSLAALQTGVHPILLDDVAIRSADIRTASDQKVQMLADRASLDNDKPDSFVYAAMEGQSLYVSEDGVLTVIANYIETNVANLPTQLVPMLFDEMLVPWQRKVAA